MESHPKIQFRRAWLRDIPTREELDDFLAQLHLAAIPTTKVSTP